MLKMFGLLTAMVFGLSYTAAVYAQTAPATTVDFSAVAEMPTLTDPTKLDTFAVNLHDAQVDTTIVQSCSAGNCPHQLCIWRKHG